MIEVTLNQPEFEYDIHSLIKAFYPSEYVGVSAEKKEYDEPVTSRMHVEYTDDAITLRWQQGEMAPAVERTFAVDPLDRPETKNRLKQNLYALLSDATGQYLPWGTLTGIRPTKIPMKLLEEGKSRDEIYTYMKQTYFASDEKICLATDIAERELSLLSKIDYDNGYSLYIGIPFCPTTCLYCSFTSYPIASWAKRVDSYLDALEREIEFAAVKFAGRHLNSIYIGGGTPTTLEPYQLDRLIRKIKCSFDLSDCLEFTVEAGRPDSITREKLMALRRFGVERISVNPQTMQDKTLQSIGRQHTVAQTKQVFALARECGFDNINMDLIIGLPGETPEDFADTLAQMRALDPDSVTIHSLVVKRASRLRRLLDEGAVPEEERARRMEQMMQMGLAFARKNGYQPYYMYRQKNTAGYAGSSGQENIGFAREGKECLYNILIMEEMQSIAALGAGASTKCYDRKRHIVSRVENVKSVTDYISRIDEMLKRKQEHGMGD